MKRFLMPVFVLGLFGAGLFFGEKDQKAQAATFVVNSNNDANEGACNDRHKQGAFCMVWANDNHLIIIEPKAKARSSKSIRAFALGSPPCFKHCKIWSDATSQPRFTFRADNATFGSIAKAISPRGASQSATCSSDFATS